MSKYVGMKLSLVARDCHRETRGSAGTRQGGNEQPAQECSWKVRIEDDT